MTTPTDREAKIAAAASTLSCCIITWGAMRGPATKRSDDYHTKQVAPAIRELIADCCPPAPDGKALRALRDWACERSCVTDCGDAVRFRPLLREIDRLTIAPVADASDAANDGRQIVLDAIHDVLREAGYAMPLQEQIGAVVQDRDKLRAENARLQTDLAAARADQAAMAREQLTAVLGEVVANYETRWDRDIEIRWCPQRWLRTYITTRLAALPQPKPAAEPVPELSVPELSATVNSEIAALTADRDKWKKAASELCPKHIGGHYTTCPVCHGVRMKAERDEAVLAMKRHKPAEPVPAFDGDPKDCAFPKGWHPVGGKAYTPAQQQTLTAAIPPLPAAEPVPDTDTADDESEPIVPAALVAYGKSVGLICKKCGYGIRLCRCHWPAWQTVDSAPRHEAVLAAEPGCGMAVAKLWDDGKWRGDMGETFRPTHWVPLPPWPDSFPQSRDERVNAALTAAIPPLPIDEGRVRETVPAEGDDAGCRETRRSGALSMIQLPMDAADDDWRNAVIGALDDLDDRVRAIAGKEPKP